MVLKCQRAWASSTQQTGGKSSSSSKARLCSRTTTITHFHKYGWWERLFKHHANHHPRLIMPSAKQEKKKIYNNLVRGRRTKQKNREEVNASRWTYQSRHLQACCSCSQSVPGLGKTHGMQRVPPGRHQKQWQKKDIEDPKS